MIEALVMTLALLVTAPAGSTVWDGPPELTIAPYGGLAIVSADAGLHQSLGAHIFWRPGEALGVAARYASRWDRDGRRSDVGTLDAVWRLVGASDAAIDAAVGWAYADRSYVTASLRARWPFLAPSGGGSAIQSWFEVRYGAPFDDPGRPRLLWTELMLVLAFSGA